MGGLAAKGTGTTKGAAAVTVSAGGARSTQSGGARQTLAKFWRSPDEICFAPAALFL